MMQFITQPVPVWVLLLAVAAPILIVIGMVLSVRLPDSKPQIYDEIWNRDF